MQHSPSIVFAPASIGNLSVGFDLLGMAVTSTERKLGDSVQVQAAEQSSLEITGEYAGVLTCDPVDNLVWTALLKFNQWLDKFTKIQSIDVQLTLNKGLPVCSGLGSSATSVVAACMALNSFYDSPFNEAKLLELMGGCEAGASGSVHYDNIAPSYLGGLRLCDSSSSHTSLLEWPKEWSLVLAYSGVNVPTSNARKALPDTYPRAIVIQQMQYLAHFVDAIHKNDLVRAANNVHDLLAEPYRSVFLPNFDVVSQALKNEYNVLASGISGSGPSLFAIVDEKADKNAIKTYLQQEYCQDNGFVVLADCERKGAQLVNSLF